MNDQELSTQLDDILASPEDSELIAKITDLIMDDRFESEWNQTEQKIIFTSSFLSLVQNGGYKGYLLMPTSVEVETVIQFLRALGVSEIAESLEKASRLFIGVEPDDVDGRQAYELSGSDREKLDELDAPFFKQDDHLAEKLAEFIRKNRTEIRK